MSAEKKIPPPLPSGHYAPTIQNRPEQYSPMLQGPGTNKLVNISTRKDAFNIDPITNIATLKDGDLTVFIDTYSSVTGGLRVSARKLLDACTIILTKQTDYRGNIEPRAKVIISLEDFMTLCGIPKTKASKDETRKRVKEDLETLYRVSFEWKETDGKGYNDFAKMRLCTEIGIKNGNIILGFSPSVAEYLQSAYLMQYPNILFQLNARNPNLWPIGRKLALHNSIDNNRETGTANTLSVRSLLESAPDIPKYEEVMQGNKNVTDRIIKPLELCLDQLIEENFLSEWTYWNARNIELTYEQLLIMDYQTFISSYIHFAIAMESPDQTSRLKAKETKPIKKKNIRKKIPSG